MKNNIPEQLLGKWVLGSIHENVGQNKLVTTIFKHYLNFPEKCGTL